MNENRGLITAMIIIGIIIIVLLIAPRFSRTALSYTGSALTASTVDLGSEHRIGSSDYYYTIDRRVPRSYSNTMYYNPGTTTRYSYPATTNYTYSSSDYQYQNDGTVFSDGCTLTSPYSLTTGQPCS